MMGSVRVVLGGALLLLFLVLSRLKRGVDARQRDWDGIIQMPANKDAAAEREDEGWDEEVGTRWALLIAGSAGYGNYRHQSDVCHAYQILRRGGLKEENIVVFMHDDIASNEANPQPGTIINHPQGGDVYAGVPKDYTGSNVTVNNFYAALLGNKSSIQNGSGKVIDSGPDDHIFVYYSDHGGPGVLGMPTLPFLYANDFVEVLKKKHASGTYKKMVIYVEACESGSIFEGLLPEGLNIYVTTASNAEESSWGTYCPGMTPPPPPGYDTCLGDLYSVAWMEDSEVHNLKKETLLQQYNLIRDRTSNHNTYNEGSHVMQYGDTSINKEQLYLYMGFDPANANISVTHGNGLSQFPEEKEAKAVNQRDADLLYLWQKYQRSEEDSLEKLDTQKQIVDLMAHHMHLDQSVELIGKLLFGSKRGPAILRVIQPAGQPLVDDWDCLKTMVRTFESHCGSLSQYGMKHMRALANICNEGVTADTMARVSSEACTYIPSGPWSSLERGFSA